MNTGIRVGSGFDAHTFVPGRHLVLGGITIPYTHGLEAHSDGDAVIHALVDALLGAVGLGDIGQHFPDTKKDWKDADSRIFLRKTMEWLTEQNCTVGNVDITIIAQAPKLSGYYTQMCTLLASDMQISSSQVNIKSTTTEGMGFTGRKEGIAVMAGVLVQKKNTK